MGQASYFLLRKCKAILLRKIVCVTKSVQSKMMWLCLIGNTFNKVSYSSHCATGGAVKIQQPLTHSWEDCFLIYRKDCPEHMTSQKSWGSQMVSLDLRHYTAAACARVLKSCRPSSLVPTLHMLIIIFSVLKNTFSIWATRCCWVFWEDPVYDQSGCSPGTDNIWNNLYI